MKLRHYFPLILSVIWFFISCVVLILDVIFGHYVWGALMLLACVVGGLAIRYEITLLRTRTRFHRSPFVDH